MLLVDSSLARHVGSVGRLDELRGELIICLDHLVRHRSLILVDIQDGVVVRPLVRYGLVRLRIEVLVFTATGQYAKEYVCK